MCRKYQYRETESIGRGGGRARFIKSQFFYSPGACPTWLDLQDQKKLVV